jgi:hypothetical protein
VHVCASGVDVTVYWVIVEPPLGAGAAQEIVALLAPALAVAAVGAFGSQSVTTEFEGTDAGLAPNALLAVTEKV